MINEAMTMSSLLSFYNLGIVVPQNFIDYNVLTYSKNKAGIL